MATFVIQSKDSEFRCIIRREACDCQQHTITPDGKWNGADIDFVSSEVGWLLQEYAGPQQKNTLIRTLDGGQSWQALTPQLVHE